MKKQGYESPAMEIVQIQIECSILQISGDMQAPELKGGLDI